MSEGSIPDEFKATVQVGGMGIALVNEETGEGVRIDNISIDEWEALERVFGE